MLYLSEAQIATMVERIGQPSASTLLNTFFNHYRHRLTSHDVAALYDERYIKTITTHELYLEERGLFRLNIYHKNAFEYICRKLTPDSRVLDVGCGSGDFAIALALRGAASVIGIDFSQPAIENAEKKRSLKNLPCQFVCADVADIDLSQAYDFILLNDVSEHLADSELEPLLKSIHALLAPKGELLIHTPNGLALCNDTDTNILQQAFKLSLRWLKNWKGTERSIEQLYYDQVHINIKSYSQLKKLLQQCGFRSNVCYDEEKGKTGLLHSLASNMLVIATPM